jgi:hypothetical protein
MRNLLAAIIVLLTLAPAEAGDEVKIGATGVLHLPNSSGGDVVIFKSQDAMGRALQLYKAGADPSALDEMTACTVPPDTKALNITGDITGGFASGTGETADVEVPAGGMPGRRAEGVAGRTLKTRRRSARRRGGFCCSHLARNCRHSL